MIFDQLQVCIFHKKILTQSCLLHTKSISLKWYDTNLGGFKDPKASLQHDL